MILIVCARDIDSTLIKGDLIAWHDQESKLGKKEGIINAVTKSGRDKADYMQKSPFIILNLPLITYSDIQPIIEDMNFEGDIESGDMVATTRKYKINFDSLENRGEGSKYPADDESTTRSRYTGIESGLVRRDTLKAYNELTRNDITIEDIQVLR